MGVQKEWITKTCKVVLDDGERRYPVGEFKLTEKEPGPTLAQFADEAFKSARASLAKLMVPKYRLVVIDGEREEAYGLDRWIKLKDKTSQEYEPPTKQKIHKTAKA